MIELTVFHLAVIIFSKIVLTLLTRSALAWLAHYIHKLSHSLYFIVRHLKFLNMCSRCKRGQRKYSRSLSSLETRPKSKRAKPSQEATHIGEGKRNVLRNKSCSKRGNTYSFKLKINVASLNSLSSFLFHFPLASFSADSATTLSCVLISFLSSKHTYN